MSLLQDTNFTEFDGTRVAVRSPPATRVLGREMTSPQHSMASAAFAKFKNEAKLSIAPQTQRRVVLEDGSVMLMSSGYGDDRVIIWPAGGEEDDANEPRGIGIVFTDLAGEPIPGWLYTDADGNAFPQPLILKHHKSDTAEPGTWTVARVKQLLGGQRLWTNETRTQWLSVFCAADELQMGSFSVDMSATRTPELALINRDWTALENDRIAVGGSSGDGFYGSWGQYLFQRNETVRLMSVSSKYPAFLTKTPGHLYQHVLMYVRVGDDWGFQLLRAEAAKVSGLQKFGAVLAPEHYLNTIIPIATPGGVEPALQSLSVHPDGKRAMSMAWPLVTPSLDARYIMFEIGETATATGHTHALPAFPGPPTASGAFSQSTSSVIVATPVDRTHFVGHLVDDEWDPTAEPIFITIPSALSGTRTTTSTTTAAHDANLDTTCLSRLYYDLAGNTVTESVAEVTQSSTSFSASSVAVDEMTWVYPVDLPGQFRVDSSTYTENATGSRTQTTNITLDLMGAVIAIHTSEGSSSSTYSKNLSNGTGTQSLSISGNLTRTSRKVIHFDSVNGVLVYYELAESAALAGTLNRPSDADMAAAVNTLRDSITPMATASLKVARVTGGLFSTVFSYPIAVSAEVGGIHLPAPLAADWRYPWAAVNSLASTTEQPVGLTGFVVTNPGPVGLAYELTTNSVTVPHTSSQSSSGGAKQVVAGGAAFGISTTDPLQYMTFKSAHDPKTLAIVMSLTFDRQAFDGGENQSWIWAADEQSVRNLTDILTFEDAGAKPMIGEVNALNTLVSI